jgi:CBS domain-containing protein
LALEKRMTSQSAAVESRLFTCKRTDNVFAAIEKCLDNGLGACLVVSDDQSLVGRITLDDIRCGILDGHVLTDTSLDRYIHDGVRPRRRPAASAATNRRRMMGR